MLDPGDFYGMVPYVHFPWSQIITVTLFYLRDGLSLPSFDTVLLRILLQTEETISSKNFHIYTDKYRKVCFRNDSTQN
jgi:hypothetical protein